MGSACPRTTRVGLTRLQDDGTAQIAVLSMVDGSCMPCLMAMNSRVDLRILLRKAPGE